MAANSLRAVSETTVCLNSFANVDLFFQGYYYFRCRLFYELEEANLRVYAAPSRHYLTRDLELRSKNTEQHRVQ